jgi:DNA-binding transcriptional LysR family regulator
MAQAARALNVSEPALADAIGKLEDVTGLQLLERYHARGVRLTAQGRHFLTAVQRLLRVAEDVELLAADLARDVAGELRLGCFQTIAPFILPALIRASREAFPRADFRAQEDHHHRLVIGVIDGSFDLVVIYGMTVLPPEVEVRALVRLQPYAVLPADHPLARRSEVTLAELAQDPIVLFDLPGSADYFEGLFARAGLAPSIAFRSQSSESVRSVVANGLGVSVLVMRPPTDLSYDGGALASVPLDRSVPGLDILAAWRRDAPVTPLRQHALDTLETYIRANAPDFALVVD